MTLLIEHEVQKKKNNNEALSFIFLASSQSFPAEWKKNSLGRLLCQSKFKQDRIPEEDSDFKGTAVFVPEVKLVLTSVRHLLETLKNILMWKKRFKNP